MRVDITKHSMLRSGSTGKATLVLRCALIDAHIFQYAKTERERITRLGHPPKITKIVANWLSLGCLAKFSTGNTVIRATRATVLTNTVALHSIRFILNFCDSAAAFSPSSVLGRRDRTLLASAA